MSNAQSTSSLSFKIPYEPPLLPSTSLDQSKPGGSPEHGHSIYEHSRPSSANQVAGMDRSQPGLYVYVEHLLEQ